MAARKPLTEFSQQARRAQREVRCLVCSLPERKEIEQAKEEGVFVTEIRQWIISELGIAPEDATKHKVSRHWVEGHAE